MSLGLGRHLNDHVVVGASAPRGLQTPEVRTGIERLAFVAPDLVGRKKSAPLLAAQVMRPVAMPASSNVSGRPMCLRSPSIRRDKYRNEQPVGEEEVVEERASKSMF